MSKFVGRSNQVLIDLVVLSLALWIAFLLRFEGALPEQMLKRAMFVWPYVVAFQYLLLAVFRVPSFAWRYVGLWEVKRILRALLFSSSGLLAARIIMAELIETDGRAQYAVVPLGVIVMNLLLAFLGITGVRVLRRIGAEVGDIPRRPSHELAPMLLVGAGQAGLVVAKEIGSHPELGIRAVGFVDDDPLKVGTAVHGLPVLGSTQQLSALCEKHHAREVLITIANARGKDIRRIKELCDAAGISAKIVPGIGEIVGGHVNLSRIRSVTINDLLRREPVVLETDAVLRAVKGETVLVTGAGGSIASELCRQLCAFGPKRLLLVERAENSLVRIHRELVSTHPELNDVLIPCIADIRDGARMHELFRTHSPTTVFHGAAHKHVPMMEWNSGEAIKNNVLGTKALADLSHQYGIREFVMISTDKAVNPTSVMGVTKRIAEIYLQALSQRSETRFVTVRFGNVLGSAESVVPIFQEQIARGGPVTVTHPEMQRYFMTIPEACQLVLQAASMGKGGEIFILNMGEPVRISDLASDLIRLSGLRPGEDIDVVYTGIRPGEKLFEELSVAEEFADRTRHPKIFIGRIQAQSWDHIKAEIAALSELSDPIAIGEKLREIVPEYRPEGYDLPAASPDPDSVDLPRLIQPSPFSSSITPSIAGAG